MAYQGGHFYDGDDPMMNYMQNIGRGGARKRFDEYYRCYPTVMLPGAEREYLNFGGKIIMPPSALDKLTKLHITYPMLFELINGKAGGKHTHAGVLEFVAEEGKAYLPQWMMNTLGFEVGDLVQIKSTDLPSASLVKLQPQDTSFLEISDPKAVLETAFRGFSTLTQGDIFSFSYNDSIYDVAVLEVKPVSDKMGVSMLETDVEVDFAAPLGYVEPTSSRASGTSTPAGLPAGGMLHSQGTMAQAINYDAIAPNASAALAGQKAVSSNFLHGGQKLNSKKNSKTPTPKASTPVAGTSTNPPAAAVIRRTNGPQPLRLGDNRLFFGYEIRPVKTQADKDRENAAQKQPFFQGQGQTLKGGKVPKKEEEEEFKDEGVKKFEFGGTGEAGKRLDGKGGKK